jgi:transcription elongation factor Elf1
MRSSFGFRMAIMLKICTLCRVQKQRDNFNRDSHRKDGLQNVCRECSAQRSRLYYQTHTQEHREATKKRRNENRKQLRQRIDVIKRRFGCRVCGESDIVCLDFHHLNPNIKDFDIAQTMNHEWSWERVLEEIRKCVCLCANCHRKVHAGRFGVAEAMLCDV